MELSARRPFAGEAKVGKIGSHAIFVFRPGWDSGLCEDWIPPVDGLTPEQRALLHERGISFPELETSDPSLAPPAGS